MNGLVGGPELVGGLGPRTLGPPLNLALLRVTYTQWRIQDFCKGGAAAGAFGVPQAPSCPLSLRPLRKFRGS